MYTYTNIYHVSTNKWVCGKYNKYNVQSLLSNVQWAKGKTVAGLILGLRQANERRRYKVTPSLIGWAQN